MDELFDIDNAQWGVISTKEKVEKPNIHNAGSARRKTEMLDIPENTRYRRAYGEVKLLELAGLEELKENHSYHFITGGDVDSLSFLKFVMLHCPQLEYLLCSTWCMAAADILQFREWIEGGGNTTDGLLCWRDIPQFLWRRMVYA